MVERRIQERVDGFMFVSIPRNCGYIKNQLVDISDPLPNIDKDDIISSLPPKQRLIANEKYTYTNKSQVPDLPK